MYVTNDAVVGFKSNICYHTRISVAKYTYFRHLMCFAMKVSHWILNAS
jgi:hypothetical protein